MHCILESLWTVLKSQDIDQENARPWLLQFHCLLVIVESEFEILLLFFCVLWLFWDNAHIGSGVRRLG